MAESWLARFSKDYPSAMETSSGMLGQSVQAVASILSIKPAQRTAEDVERLVTFLSEQPFFEGVSSASLELLSACLGIQQASPGEVVLHAGELTDRLYVLLNGSCSIVRHSRREGYKPQQPQKLASGQAFCEAALVASGRRSDVAVTASEPGGLVVAADTDSGTSGDEAGKDSGGGECSRAGATLIVLTRTAWSNMCARAPTKPEYGEARLALLCCCARSLAASDPTGRTLEQAEDLAALLRLLPGFSHTPAPVLRAMSESAYLRQLPPGTILFEECTRAESQFLVLAGAVETHARPKRQGAANRAALRSALRSAVAAARGKSARGAPKPAGEPAPKTLRQKIEDERRSREQIKQSLALQREGLRTPKPNSNRPAGARAVEAEFKRWMLEFLTRKRGDNTANTAAATASLEGRAGRSGLHRTVSIKAANAWRRAAAKALQSGGTAAGSNAGGGAMERKDSTLEEYERRKMEEAGGLKDVGNLLGGAAARKAYMRGLATKDGGMYAEDEPESNGAAAGTEALRTNKVGGVHWGTQDAHSGGAEGEEAEVEDVDEEEEEADPWVRLTFLDRRYQVVRKAIRYIDAVEKVMGVAKQESADSSKPPQGGGGQTGAAGGGDPDADPDEFRASDESQLLLLNGGDDVSAATSDSGGTGGAGSSAAAAGGTAAVAADGPGPDDTVDDACDEHLEQLYGPCGGRVEVGQVAGELPAAVLDKSKKSGQQRMRRAHSAIASPSGASVLVVVLEALRRGHEAARDDLVSERLAVLTALEPLRGLSDEHQAQLALGCTVVSLDTNQVIVRQCQLVDALFVVLEGEVRLLDDPDTTPTVAPPPQQPQQPAGGGAGGGGTTVNGASGAAASGGGNTADATPSDSPFRTATAAAGGGKLMSLKIRRAAATLAALTLLGPGGSFGESVLGYPEDVAAAAAAAAAAARESWEGDGGESTVPPSQYLATAMTSRPTKLLVMPRSLLVRYGYLRASLPPFANLRREAINGRRQQLQAGLQNRPAAAAVAAATAAATAAAVASNSGGGTSGGPGRTSTNGAGIARGASDSFLGVTQLPSLSSPTAPMVAGTFQTPRPPPKRPSEVLEQLGFKPVLRRLYNAGGKLGAAATSPNGASPAAALGNSNSNCNHNNSSSSNNNNGISGGGVGGPSPLPPPLPSTHAINSFAPAAGGSDRQHRKDLLAASVLAANNPQSLWNAIARARAEEATSLPSVVHSTASSAAPTPSYRGSADGSFTSATGSPGGFVLPTPFSTSKMRPLRLSISGVGNCANDNGSPSPVRRASVSGLIGSNSPGGGGGISIPMLVSPTRGGGGGSAVARVHATSMSAPNPHVASVQLPRLSAAGNSNSAAATPTTGGVRMARPSIPGEPFLVRLEAAEPSPRSFSSQAPGPGNAGRSASLGSLVNGGGSGGGTAVAPLPLSVTLLGQRSGGHQPAARA